MSTLTPNATMDPRLQEPETVARFPFRGPFFEKVSKRKKQGRDAKIMITANGETGVGKTHCSYYLAMALDTSPQGFLPGEKATTDMQQYLAMYDELAKGSAMVFDESEQLDSRRAMKQENVDAAMNIMTRRLNELVQIFVLPAKKPLDPRIEELMNYWVYIDMRGEAVIYQDTSSKWQDTFWSELQVFQWPNLDETKGIHIFDRLKDNLIEDSTSADYIEREEAEKEIEKKQAESQKQTREKFIQKLNDKGKTYPEIAEEVEEVFGDDLSPGRIGQIARGEG